MAAFNASKLVLSLISVTTSVILLISSASFSNIFTFLANFLLTSPVAFILYIIVSKVFWFSFIVLTISSAIFLVFWAFSAITTEFSAISLVLFLVDVVESAWVVAVSATEITEDAIFSVAWLLSNAFSCNVFDIILFFCDICNKSDNIFLVFLTIAFTLTPIGAKGPFSGTLVANSPLDTLSIISATSSMDLYALVTKTLTII